MWHPKKPIICADCGMQVEPTGQKQVCCLDCRKARKRSVLKRINLQKKAAAALGKTLDPYCWHCKNRHPQRVDDIDELTYTKTCLHCGNVDEFIKSTHHFDRF